MVGTITFTVDYLVFILIYSLIDSVLFANFCAGLISISMNYLAHYFWTFKSKADHSRSGIKYLLNLIIFWVVGTLLLKTLVTEGVEAKYAKLIPVLFVASLSFLTLKFIVFTKPKSDNYLLVNSFKKSDK